MVIIALNSNCSGPQASYGSVILKEMVENSLSLGVIFG